MELADGEWVAFLDSDDFIDPVAFSKVIFHSKSSEADVISFNGYRFIEECGKSLPLYHKPNPFKNKGLVSGQDYLRLMLKEGMANTVTVWDKLYRKSTLTKFNLKFIEGLIHEDVPFTFELFLNDIFVEYQDLLILNYRQRPGSIMHSFSYKVLFSRNYILEKLLILLKNFNINCKDINAYPLYLARRSILLGGSVPRKMIFEALLRRTYSMKKFQIIALLPLNLTNRLRNLKD